MFLHHGGDPRLLDDLPWQDILDWLMIHDVVEARTSLGGLPDE